MPWLTVAHLVNARHTSGKDMLLLSEPRIPDGANGLIDSLRQLFTHYDDNERNVCHMLLSAIR